MFVDKNIILFVPDIWLLFYLYLIKMSESKSIDLRKLFVNFFNEM